MDLEEATAKTDDEVDQRLGNEHSTTKLQDKGKSLVKVIRRKKGRSAIELKAHCCNLCGKTFKRISHLRQHMPLHATVMPFNCTICAEGFPRNDYLQAHMVKHTGKKPFSCDVCGKGFLRRSTLKQHVHLHTGERPYSCPVCCQSFSHKQQLRVHSYKHTSTPASETCNNSNGTIDCLCSACGQLFQLQDSFENKSAYLCGVCEKRSQHGDIAMESESNEGAREQPEKLSSFKTSSSQLAVQVNEPINELYSNKGALEPDQITEWNQSSEKSDFHQIEPYGWGSRADNTELLKVVTVEQLPEAATLSWEPHTQSFSMQSSDKKPIICVACGECFLNNGMLKKHKCTSKGKKAKKKPCTCTICGKTLAQTSNLKRHMLWHTGEKQFECSICGKLCAAKSALQEHMRRHTGDKPYKCTRCKKQFAHGSGLRNHKCLPAVV